MWLGKCRKEVCVCVLVQGESEVGDDLNLWKWLNKHVTIAY